MGMELKCEWKIDHGQLTAQEGSEVGMTTMVEVGMCYLTELDDLGFPQMLFHAAECYSRALSSSSFSCFQTSSSSSFGGCC